MKKRIILGMIGLALALVAGMISLAQASPKDDLLTGIAKVTKNTRPGICSAPDRLRICRERTSIFQIETNDARLNGEAFLVFDTISTKIPFSERSRGYFRMMNGSGGWVGIWMGTIDSGRNTHITVEAQGKGSYSGLIARWQMERSNSNGWEPLTVSGSIQRGRPDPGKR